jgi:cytochrome c oxidase subunit 2
MLLDAVHEHLERVLHIVREINAAPLYHALYDASRVRRTVFATLVTCVVALSTAALAYAGNAGFLPGGADSPNGQRIHDAFYVVALFTGIIFVVVEGALILFIVKYRRGKRERSAEGPQVHGATRLEVIWTVIPVVFLAAIGSFVFYKLPGIEDPPKADAANSTTIRVDGHQFYWQFTYPNGAVSIDRMRAPAGEVVNEEISAPLKDVIHSWWVPDFGGKFDAIPGKVNKTWFKAPVGLYKARCYELCGIQHAAMTARVQVMPPDQYRSFIEHRASDAGQIDLGHEVFRGVCQKCHRLGSKYIGPDLKGNPLLANRQSLEVLLRNGQGQMPPVGYDWSDRQIDALVLYTKQFAPQGGDTNGG